MPSFHSSNQTGRVYVFGFFWMFLVIIPVIVPYLLSLGLTMEQIFLLKATFGVTVALTEVPSGYLADLWGRKHCMVIGTFLSGVSFTYLTIADSFAELLVYEIVCAVATSLVSGTDLALLYDSLKQRAREEGHEDRSRFTKALGWVELSKVSGESLAALLGGALAMFTLKWVVYGHAVFGWIPFLVALTFREPEFERLDKRAHWTNTKTVLKHVFASDWLIALTFVNLVFYGLAGFIVVWIFQKHWHEGGIELGYFGGLWAAYTLTVGIVGAFVPRLEQRFGPVIVLLALGLLPIAGYFGMGALSGWTGAMCGFLFKAGRGITQVILRDALNWRTPSAMRATVNSLASLCFRASFAIIGPAVGFLIDRDGVYRTMSYLGWMYVAVFLVCLLPLILMVRRLSIARAHAVS